MMLGTLPRPRGLWTVEVALGAAPRTHTLCGQPGEGPAGGVQPASGSRLLALGETDQGFQAGLTPRLGGLVPDPLVTE